jgi:ribosomal-protein-alanine N-acetyltransferase
MVQGDVDTVLTIEQSVQQSPWTRGNLCDALSGCYWCCVDEWQGTLRAYAILMPLVDEGELLTIGVVADQQRKGLGRMMLNKVLGIARDKNMKRVFLEVRQSNVAAIALYLSAGFREIGVRRGYYQNAGASEDALLMRCELTGESNG